MARSYRLGRRQDAVDRTASAILAAARRQLEDGLEMSVAAVARRAQVTRATVYNRFGSQSGLLLAVIPEKAQTELVAQDPREWVHQLLAAGCSRWAANPALHRRLPPADNANDLPRRLAEGLAAADVLRPGCSLKEAEDVIATLSSFPVFDQLHRDGRRSAAAVTEILMRLAGAILA